MYRAKGSEQIYLLTGKNKHSGNYTVKISICVLQMGSDITLYHIKQTKINNM